MEKHCTQPKSLAKPQVSENESDSAPRQSRLTWLVPLALLALLVVLYFVWPGFRQFMGEAYGRLTSGDQEAIQSWVSGFGLWGPAVIVLAMLMQTILMFIPSVLLMVVAVLAFGPVWGSLLSWAGLLLAAALAYGIGRALGPVTVDRLIGPKLEQKLGRYVERYGLWAVAAARISPILSTDAVSYAAGLAGMGLFRFLAATALGILPLAVPIAILGSDFTRLAWVLAALSVLSLAAIAIHAASEQRTRDRRKKRQPEKASQDSPE